MTSCTLKGNTLRAIGNDAHGVVVHDLHFFDYREDVVFGQRFICGHTLQRPLYIRGRERVAIVPGDVVAQLEFPGGIVNGFIAFNGASESGRDYNTVDMSRLRRKIDYSQLPYLLAPKEKNGRQKGGLNKENVDILQTQVKVSPENDDIFRQTKLNQTKLYSEEEDKHDASFEIPGYAYNQATHNINGLIESLDRYKVTSPEEKQTILRLSDYGRKGTQVWRLFSSTSWSKIGAPGKYIIAALTNKR